MSLRKAINAHCKSCGFDNKSGLGNWRQQIETCPCTKCALYDVRPRTTSKRAFLQDNSSKECLGSGVQL